MFIYTFIYIYICTQTHTQLLNSFLCGGQVSTLDVILQIPPALVFFRLFTGIQTLRTRLGLWDSEPQRSYCLYLFRTGIVRGHYYPWLLHGYWGSNSVLSLFAWLTITQLGYFPTSIFLFLKSCINYPLTFDRHEDIGCCY